MTSKFHFLEQQHLAIAMIGNRQSVVKSGCRDFQCKWGECARWTGLEYILEPQTVLLKMLVESLVPLSRKSGPEFNIRSSSFPTRILLIPVLVPHFHFSSPCAPVLSWLSLCQQSFASCRLLSLKIWPCFLLHCDKDKYSSNPFVKGFLLPSAATSPLYMLMEEAIQSAGFDL